MTVAQLILKLAQFPADALVAHEGCDCTGLADNVIANSYDAVTGEVNEVLITRNN